jgi:hypothetical protein
VLVDVHRAEDNTARLANLSRPLRAKNPQLAQDMRNWFAVKPGGKPINAMGSLLNC